MLIYYILEFIFLSILFIYNLYSILYIFSLILLLQSIITLEIYYDKIIDIEYAL